MRRKRRLSRSKNAVYQRKRRAEAKARKQKEIDLYNSTKDWKDWR